MLASFDDDGDTKKRAVFLLLFLLSLFSRRLEQRGRSQAHVREGREREKEVEKGDGVCGIEELFFVRLS